MIQFAHRMFNAARNGDAPLLLQAVDVGLPVNMTNDEGNTLLMLAAYNGHLDLTKGLVDRGADVNRVNDRGQSPLAGVVFKGYDEIATFLAEKGADPRFGTPTAIQTARMFNKTHLLQLMGATDEDMKEVVPLPPGPPPSNVS
ncbi:ankyrin [Trametopsis cervina]|nr:ankyrin [Trametopsis cervina]